MHHVMLDLETLGTAADAAILSIGAVRFDPVKGVIDDWDTFYAVVRDSEGSSDPDTVLWWLRQSADARAAVADPLGDVFVCSEFGVLTLLTQWLGDDPKGLQLWSNGPTFDEVILRSAYARAGMDWPFSFRRSRCCRTLRALAELAGFGETEQDARALGILNLTPHRADHDAIRQAYFACLHYTALGLGPKEEA